MKKNRTFEDQALHDVREAVKNFVMRKQLNISHTITPVFTMHEAFTVRTIHKPSDQIWH